MIQNFLLLLSFLVFSIFSMIPNKDIEVKMEVPPEVRAGEEFIVTLQISKGDLESFSRYSQSLPYGLTAEKLSTVNADFSFEEQRVRIIWLKLPPEDSLTVTYKIKVNQSLTGAFKLSGDFSFVNQNERDILTVESGHLINIIPNPSVAENERIDIDDYQILALREESNEPIVMEVVRSEPVKTTAFEYKVEINIKKGDLSKFAKIEEYIPEGFRVIEDNSQNGIFSFNQGVVKILWMNLPAESEFTVSYRIVPDPGKNIEAFDANGTFSYISANETKSIDILNESIDLPGLLSETDADTSNLETGDTSQKYEIENTDYEIDTFIENPELLAEEPEISEMEDIEEEIQENEALTAKPIEDKPVEAESVEPEVRPSEAGQTFDIDPEADVYYRVQLAAGHREINIEKYFKRFNVEDEVNMEFHEGWRKYTTGSFDVYSNARDYRNRIWETTPLNGAFISAYYDGSRITVQEALMITKQKWHQ